MGVRKFFEKAGNRSSKRNVQEIYDGLKRRLAPTVKFGNSVYDREWDLLILFDSCRPDTFKRAGEPIVRESSSMELLDSETKFRMHRIQNFG